MMRSLNTNIFPHFLAFFQHFRPCSLDTFFFSKLALEERLLLSNAKLFSHCMLLIILKSDFRKFDADTKVVGTIDLAGGVLYIYMPFFLSLSLEIFCSFLSCMTCPCLDCGFCP